MSQAVDVGAVRMLLVRLLPGESVMESFGSVLDEHRISRAAVLSGIGSFVRATFLGVRRGATRPFGLNKATRVSARGPFEVLSLEGNVFPTDRERVVHLHVSLGTSDGGVIGGHLVDAEVYTTVEMLLIALDGCTVRKAADPVAGGIQLQLPSSAASVSGTVARSVPLPTGWIAADRVGFILGEGREATRERVHGGRP